MWDSCYISNTNNNSCIAYGIINSTAWCEKNISKWYIQLNIYSTSANSINYNYSSLTIMCDISSYSSYSSFSSRYSSSYSWVIHEVLHIHELLIFIGLHVDLIMGSLIKSNGSLDFIVLHSWVIHELACCGLNVSLCWSYFSLSS